LRDRISLDQDWRFQLGDKGKISEALHRSWFAKAGGVGGASSPEFDDSSWREVDVPHDWGVELPFDKSKEDSVEYVFHGFKPIGPWNPETSIGWYRRTLEISKGDLDKRITLEFDGVFRDSIVWLNGHYLGRHGSGYTSFSYDISDVANYGGDNVLVVRVDATHYEGWWYEGAGIHRHVWLVKTSPVHVAKWGTYIVSDIKENSASVTVRTRIRNEDDKETTAELKTTILNADGYKITETRLDCISLNGWEETEFQQYLEIENPIPWSIDNPHMYRLLTTIIIEGEIVDEYETLFGIRTIRFDPDNGFFLNDQHVVIKGVCAHPDHAGVGAAVPDRIHEYRLERLKEMGANAIRAPHYRQLGQ